MDINPDFRDLFTVFNDAGVEYLVIGAHAVGLYAPPRLTKDVDIWVNPSPQNAERVYRALTDFMGAPPHDLSIEDLTNPDLVYQIGVAPNRVDILMGIEPMGFDEAWPNREPSTYGGTPIQVIGKADLIRSKRAAGRPQDLLDLEQLE